MRRFLPVIAGLYRYDRRSGHFSPSWLAALRFTSVEKRPDRLSFNAQGLAGGLPAMFFEEVKRTEGSHDEKKSSPEPALDINRR